MEAAAAGTWRLGDLEVNRMGFGAMRLQTGRALVPDAVRERGQAAVLLRAVEIGVPHRQAASTVSPWPANVLLTAARARTRPSWSS